MVQTAKALFALE